jgi:hypothetical protein
MFITSIIRESVSSSAAHSHHQDDDLTAEVEDFVQEKRRAARTALSPPNANEFDNAVRIGISRATFGT